MGLKATDPLVFTLKHIAGDDPSLGYRFDIVLQLSSTWLQLNKIWQRCNQNCNDRNPKWFAKLVTFQIVHPQFV